MGTEDTTTVVEDKFTVVDPMTIPGMITGVECEWLMRVAKGRKEIVEIGCWRGRSTVALVSQCAGKVWCVDPWQTWLGHPEYGYGDETYRAFMKNVEPWRTKVRVLRMESIEAWELLRVLAKPDMIFVDGDHSYEMAKYDIQMALQMMKRRGGLICGHDYNKTAPGVIQAVKELVPKAELLGGYVFGTWYYEIP